MDAVSFEERVGSPWDKWTRLKDRVQQEDLKKFSDVTGDFLDVLWCLDQYKIHGVAPRGMARDLNGAYRMKGNFFADLVSLLLINQTNSPLAPRGKVRGFSQLHQIDIAWPKGHKAPLVCVETKVMGGPPVGSQTARAATADWTNRRKELKFQATDLKLYRRQQETQIDHWDNWRRGAAPTVYFLWCARMKAPADRLDRMVRELRALSDTYLDGAGLFAYRENGRGTGYEAVPIPWEDRKVDLDDLIHSIADHINHQAASGAHLLDVEPAVHAVDVSALDADSPEGAE